MSAMNLRERLVSSLAYKSLLRIRSLLQFFRVMFLPVIGHRETAYCVSPYKSGTTYFSGLFSKVCRSEHEPMMHATLLNFNNSRFLKRRARNLKLDLECSGFFAGRLSTLRRFAPHAKVIFLTRHPEEWIGSVVNYFSDLSDRVTYNYVARLIFDPICIWHVDQFYNLTFSQQRDVVRRLLLFWIDVYTEALQDKQSMVVPLEEVDTRLAEISDFLGLPRGHAAGVWKRENRSKRDFSLADYIDLSQYVDKVKLIGYEL